MRSASIAAILSLAAAVSALPHSKVRRTDIDGYPQTGMGEYDGRPHSFYATPSAKPSNPVAPIGGAAAAEPTPPPQTTYYPPPEPVTQAPQGGEIVTNETASTSAQFEPGVLQTAITDLCELGISLNGTVITGPRNYFADDKSQEPVPMPYYWQATTEDYGWGEIEGYKCDNIPTADGQTVTLFMKDSVYHPNRCFAEGYTPIRKVFTGNFTQTAELPIHIGGVGCDFDYILKPNW